MLAFLSSTDSHSGISSSKWRGKLAPLRSVFPTSPAMISSVDDLFEFICNGPLVERLGFTAESIAESIDRWLQCGVHLCQLFQLNQLRLSVPEKVRIYHYYVPVFVWCEDEVLQHKSTFKDGNEVPPLVVCSHTFSLISH